MKKIFDEIATEWLEYKCSLVKESTIAAYRFKVRKYLLPAFGGSKEIREAAVQKFVSSSLEAGLGAKIVKDALVVLHMIVKYGAKKRWCSAADWDVVFPVNATRHRTIDVLTQKEHRQLMDYTLEHPTVLNFGIYVCLTTGLRIGEICGLKWEDIDFRKRTLTVRRTIERILVEGSERKTKVVESTPKTVESNRTVPLDGQTTEVAQRLRPTDCGDAFVLTGSATPMEPRVYRRYFDRVTQEAGLRRIKFHGLRHSFSTRCIESGCDYKTVSVILGHSDISTTLNTYVHPNMEQKKRCISKMLGMVKGRSGSKYEKD